MFKGCNIRNSTVVLRLGSSVDPTTIRGQAGLGYSVPNSYSVSDGFALLCFDLFSPRCGPFHSIARAGCLGRSAGSIMTRHQAWVEGVADTRESRLLASYHELPYALPGLHTFSFRTSLDRCSGDCLTCTRSQNCHGDATCVHLLGSLHLAVEPVMAAAASLGVIDALHSHRTCRLTCSH